MFSPTDLQEAIEPVPLFSASTPLSEVVQIFNADQAESAVYPDCILITENNQLVGIVTPTHLLQRLRQNPSLEMGPLATVMSAVRALQLGQIQDMGQIMQWLEQPQIKHLPILDPEGRPLGVITYRSLAHWFYRCFEQHFTPLTGHTATETSTEIQDWQQLETKNALLATALEHVAEGIEITDIHAKLLYVNPAMETITGYNRSEMLNRISGELFRSSKQRDEDYKTINHTLMSGEIWRGSLIARRKEGDLCYQEATISPVCNTDGQITHFVAVKRDITDRKRIEEALRLTQFAVDRAADAIIWMRPDGRFIYVNKAACRLFGYSAAELLLMSIQDLDPVLLPEKWAYYWQQIKQRGSLKFESYHRGSQGQEIAVEVNTNYLEFNGQEYSLAFIRDVSERKQFEAHLQTSLDEKDLLLKEIHHRVKNNLQVISSIFSLQAHYIVDPAILSILTESRHRIQSMSLIHEKLYQSGSLISVNFSEYIHALARGLFASYNINRHLIDLNLNITDIPLGVDTATPCGLLINELVSNALKHAFPEQASGKVYIDFFQHSDTELCLRVRDSGKGISADLDLYQSRSLGFRLIRALVRQLRGRLEITNQSGASFSVIFPKP